MSGQTAPGAEPSEPEQARPGTPTPPAADRLVLDGESLPCYVRVVVYAGGRAAALGIQTPHPEALRAVLADRTRSGRLRPLLAEQVRAEVERQRVVSGLREDEVDAAIDGFLAEVGAGTGCMVSRRIAEGEAPQPGQDGWLEYVINPHRGPAADLGRAEQRRLLRRVYQARRGEALVVVHPPAGGRDGVGVRGEPLPPARRPRAVGLQGVGGANTVVEGRTLRAALDGLYQEDRRGRVWVVQELCVEAVDPATGDLPRAGVAAVNVQVRRRVARGASVSSSETVFVGAAEEPGMIEAGSRVRARHLLVRGPVVGDGLPAAYLRGDAEALDEPERRQVRDELDGSLVDVERLFAAREVSRRFLRAGRVLVQGPVLAAGLEAEGPVCVDGDLTGGTVTCRRLQVGGDLGCAEGTVTRVRLSQEPWARGRRAGLRAEMASARTEMEDLQQQLTAHLDQLEEHARKSPYWTLLLRGERRVPRRPLEKQLLARFLQAVQERRRLERGVSDAQRRVRDLAALLREEEPEPDESGSAMEVVVAGTVHPGVEVEVVRPVEMADLGLPVVSRGTAVSLGAVKAELAEAVERYRALYEDGVEERTRDLDRMFRGRERRPAAPRLPDRRFGAPLEPAPEDRAAAGDGLALAQLLYVHAHDPRSYHLKQTVRLTAPRHGVRIAIEHRERQLLVACAPLAEDPVPWQRDAAILEDLESLSVLGRSGRQHLLG